MKILALALAALFALAATARAEAPALSPGLAGLAFLVGDWKGQGKVAESGGAAVGTSEIRAISGGLALLRRDHTDLFDAAGKPVGGFDQVMMIYPEAGAVHADFTDGGHVIHYRRAEVQPGRAVVFVSEPQAGAPTYRLSYDLAAPGQLTVTFAYAPPGSTAFRPIATGRLTRVT